MIKVYLISPPVKPADIYKPIKLECEHQKVFVKKTCVNGTFQLREQCTICGETFGNLPKTSYRGSVSSLPEIDEESTRAKRQAVYEKERLAQLEKTETVQREFSRHWWNWYNGYLQSHVWSERRRAVLERDNYQCQSCRSSNATQVHHKSYKHVGREPLFELEAVCEDCHKQLTEMDRNV